MYALKGNREYKINVDDKQRFLDAGFQIAEIKNGKIAIEKPETEADKEVAKLKAENKKLKAEVAKLKKEAN